MEYDHREYLLDDLYEARKRWAKAEYITTPRVMERVGIDVALDALVEYDKGVAEFETVFGDGSPNQFDIMVNGGL